MIATKRSVVLTRMQANFLEKEARRLGITVSDLLRRIVDEYRDRNAYGGIVSWKDK